MKTWKKAAVIDLFCGIGGLTHGFVMEGFNVVAGIDSDETCKYTFENNNNSKFICNDITKVTSNEVLSLFPKDSIKILIGCAPCQSFSRYTSGNRNSDDNKWSLLLYFAKLIEDIQPEIVSMENVPQLAKYNKNGVYSDFIKTLESNGYHISDPKKIVYCPEYGIPQNRKRLVLLASKLGPIDLIPPTRSKNNLPTVKEAIGDLPSIMDGQVCESDPIHRAQKLSKLNITRMQHTKEGGSWREWPDELMLECHKKLTGSKFNDVYGRMRWNEPSPTMTTHCIGLGNGRFGHPEQNRAISLREAAILQSFPRSYNFLSYPSNKIISKDIQRHIGNAVPVKLGQAIAISIKKHLTGFNAK
ncbi:DNA cytosine methyltransferase [Hymenobacter cellulosilyticus]|uniref:Cytosine-specific methyltransferase n=1 Tax=Hymenobacter cellulosilyticus TaxID=2932248 RepID=A0A8T9Q964_9BACT|nr:DNA cytosine methyltransferase [Hymenobacter cellulosilyticus]UOQ74096.1 DNA cytosine methyltransferase [Hymenobacter cellulosilyticus]